MTIDTFLMALAIAFIIEGLFPALFPNKWQAYVTKLSQESVQNIRSMGLMITMFGAVFLWLLS